jgi:hypothetical protein
MATVLRKAESHRQYSALPPGTLRYRFTGRPKPGSLLGGTMFFIRM